MDAFKIHADSLKSLQNEQGADCPALFYDGKLIPVCPGGALYRNSNSPGGNSLFADLQLTVLAVDFGAGFDFDSLSQQTFNYPGKAGRLYRFSSVTDAPNGWQKRILADSSAEGL